MTDRFFASLRMTKRDCRSGPAMTKVVPAMTRVGPAMTRVERTSREGCGVGGTIEGVGNKRVAGATGSRVSANGDDWGEGESVGTWV